MTGSQTVSPFSDFDAHKVDFLAAAKGITEAFGQVFGLTQIQLDTTIEDRIEAKFDAWFGTIERYNERVASGGAADILFTNQYFEKAEKEFDLLFKAKNFLVGVWGELQNGNVASFAKIAFFIPEVIDEFYGIEGKSAFGLFAEFVGGQVADLLDLLHGGLSAYVDETQKLFDNFSTIIAPIKLYAARNEQGEIFFQKFGEFDNFLSKLDAAIGLFGNLIDLIDGLSRTIRQVSAGIWEGGIDAFSQFGLEILLCITEIRSFARANLESGLFSEQKEAPSLWNIFGDSKIYDAISTFNDIMGFVQTIMSTGELFETANELRAVASGERALDEFFSDWPDYDELGSILLLEDVAIADILRELSKEFVFDQNWHERVDATMRLFSSNSLRPVEGMIAQAMERGMSEEHAYFFAAIRLQPELYAAEDAAAQQVIAERYYEIAAGIHQENDAGHNVLVFGAEDDVVVDEGGNDHYGGGHGHDRVSFIGSGHGRLFIDGKAIVNDASVFNPEEDHFSRFEHLVATNHDDTVDLRVKLVARPNSEDPLNRFRVVDLVAGDDVFHGTELDETVDAGSGNNTVKTYDGDDAIAIASDGNNVVDGGDGEDTLRISSTVHQHVHGVGDRLTIVALDSDTTSVADNMEEVRFGDGGTTIVLEDTPARIYAMGAGFDTVHTQVNGSVFMGDNVGDNDNDSISYSLSADGIVVTIKPGFFLVEHNSVFPWSSDRVYDFGTLIGTAHDDVFSVLAPSVYETVSGGGDGDWDVLTFGALYDAAHANVHIRMMDGHVDFISDGLVLGWGFAVEKFEHIVGSAGGDLVYADVNLSRFDGGEGCDTLHAVSELLDMDGGSGDDVVDYDGLRAAIVWTGSRNIFASDTSTVRWLGDEGYFPPTWSSTNVERVVGTRYGDVFTLDEGMWIDGNDGNDTITGSADNDMFYGGEGSDTFSLGAGADTVDGGSSTFVALDGQIYEHIDVVDYTDGVYASGTTGGLSHVVLGTEGMLVHHTSSLLSETDILFGIEHLRFGDQHVRLIFADDGPRPLAVTSGAGIGTIDLGAVESVFVGTWSAANLTLTPLQGAEPEAAPMVSTGFDVWKAGTGVGDTLVVWDQAATLATRPQGTVVRVDTETDRIVFMASHGSLATEGIENFVLPTLGFAPITVPAPQPGVLPSGIAFTIHSDLVYQSRTMDFSGHAGRVLWRAAQSLEAITQTTTNGWIYSGIQATFEDATPATAAPIFSRIIGTNQHDALQGVVGQTLDAGGGTDHINIFGADSVAGGEGADVFRWIHTATRTGAQSNVQVVSDFGLDDTFVAGAMAGNQVSWTQTEAGTIMKHVGSGRSVLFEGALQADVVARTLFENGRMWVGTHANDTDNRSASPDGWALHGLGGIDHLYGGKGEDKLYGGQENDRLWGSDDHDMLYGGTGNDSLYGGHDNDNLWGGDGDDLLHSGNGYATWVQNLHGEAGNDTLDLTGAYGGGAYGGTGNDFIWGGGMVASANLNVFGGDGDDRMRGAKGPTTESTLRGGNGNDWIDGSLVGIDTLYGDAGHDLLFAMGQGNIAPDIMFGGAGRDVFAIAALPRKGVGSGHIRDFDPEEDRLHIDPDMFTAWNRATRTQSGPNLTITFEGGTNITPNRLIIDGVTWDELVSATQLGGNAETLWMSLW